MKKVLFLIHTLGGGGAEKVLVDLVNNLDKKKFDITVMTIVDVGELKYKLNDNIKYKTTIKLRRKRNNNCNNNSGSLLNDKTSFFKKILIKIYSFFWRHFSMKLFYKIFIKEKYDIEISFLEGICAKVISASSNKISKKYAWIHVDLSKQTKSQNVFKNLEDERKVYNRFDKIICVSNVVKSTFMKKYNINDKVIVKYNAINKNKIFKMSNEKCEKLKNDDEFLIISIGRLNAQKSYERLLEIGKKLIDESYNIRIIIIGEGTHRESLQNYINNNKLNDYITLLGFKNNPYPYLKQADLFVCSSITEGFSTVVSESIILGIPVVTTNCSGMDEMLGKNNQYGIITDNNVESLYCGIKKVLDNKEIYFDYKRKTAERGNIFELKQLINSVEELLDE